MAMVDADGSAFFPADSQSKLLGLVWEYAVTRRLVPIYQMNRVNSRIGLPGFQHHKFGVVRGHSRSREISPFDGAHTSSY